MPSTVKKQQSSRTYNSHQRQSASGGSASNEKLCLSFIPLAFSLLFEQVVTSAVLYQTLTVGSTSEDF